MTTEPRLLKQVHVPAYSGGGADVARGQRVKVVNIQGKQVGDFFAFRCDDPEEYVSPRVTVGRLRRIYPELGKPLYSTKRRPLLVLEEDTVGVHDLLLQTCDRRSYAERGEPDHPNCRDNLNAALARAGFRPHGTPAPVNLFQATPVVDLEGHWEVRESPAKPGDYVVFEALEDVLVVVTACSVDRGPLNGGNPTDLMLEVYG